MIAMQKRVVIEEDISEDVFRKSSCEINFGKMHGIDEEDEKIMIPATENENLEVCNPTSETIQSDVISEAKIIIRQDTIKQELDQSPEVEVSMKSTVAEVPKEESSHSSVTEKVVKKVEISDQSLVIDKKKLSTEKKKKSRKDVGVKLLSNYDIIDRTEVKKIEQETDSFSFVNLVGRFKRAFGHIEHPPYRRHSLNDSTHLSSSSSSTSHQNAIVNLSIEQTKNGEAMQVLLSFRMLHNEACH